MHCSSNFVRFLFLSFEVKLRSSVEVKPIIKFVRAYNCPSHVLSLTKLENSIESQFLWRRFIRVKRCFNFGSLQELNVDCTKAEATCCDFSDLF